MEKLKGCPFCGGEASLQHKKNTTGWVSYIKCKSCDITSLEVPVSFRYSSDQKVIELWNRRVDNGCCEVY